MTICFGKGAAERTDRSVESQSTSDPLVESDENSLFGDTIRVLEIHGESDVRETAGRQNDIQHGRPI
jgi:hypothetical protein